MTEDNAVEVNEKKKSGGRWIMWALVIAGIVGWKLHKQDATENELRAALVEVCAEETNCLAALDTHFEACFSDNYQARRRYTRFDTDGMLECLNDKGGTSFAVASE